MYKILIILAVIVTASTAHAWTDDSSAQMLKMVEEQRQMNEQRQQEYQRQQQEAQERQLEYQRQQQIEQLRQQQEDSVRKPYIMSQ